MSTPMSYRSAASAVLTSGLSQSGGALGSRELAVIGVDASGGDHATGPATGAEVNARDVGAAAKAVNLKLSLAGVSKSDEVVVVTTTTNNEMRAATGAVGVPEVTVHNHLADLEGAGGSGLDGTGGSECHVRRLPKSR